MNNFAKDGVNQSKNIEHEYFSPNNANNHHILRIKTKCNQHFTFRIEKWFDKVFKALGIVKEFQLSSGEFNEKIYIENDCPEFFADIRDHHEFQRVALTLINLGCVKIVNQGKHLSVSCKKIHNQQAFPENYNEILSLLDQLNNFLGCMPSAQLPNTSHEFRWWQIFIGVNSIVVLYGILAPTLDFNPYIKTLVDNQLLWDSLSYSVYLFLIYCAGCLIFFWQSSRLQRIVFFSILVVLPSFLVIIYHSRLYVNVKYDDLPSTVHYSRVIEKKFERGGRRRGASRHIIKVQQWEGIDYDYTLISSSSVYNLVSVD